MDEKSFSSVLRNRMNRRAFVAGIASTAGLFALGSIWQKEKLSLLPEQLADTPFKEVPHGVAAHVVVPEGYRAQTLLSWGEPLFDDAPAYVPDTPDAKAQERQFGYNNDFTAFMPLPKGSANSSHGLLCVNHETAFTERMFKAEETIDAIKAAQAAVGHSVVEIERKGNEWHVVKGAYNRRFSTFTPFTLTGPAAGHERLKTAQDTAGTTVTGTMDNCAGGVTPWHTVLFCEENIHNYFYQNGENTNAIPLHSSPRYHWAKADERFDVSRHPNEPNRFGWVCEYDPYDPASPATKRTALGRFCHEGATCVATQDGRVAVYMGDDSMHECIYRYVSHKPVAAHERDGTSPLDEGVLSVARFNDDGSVQWLELVHGTSGLTSENSFASQADVLIDARRAARQLGATLMDRPEGIAVCPLTGRVFISLTNNTARTQANAANPRLHNQWGHIIVLNPPDSDHTALNYRWDMLLLAGNPEKHEGARYPGSVSRNGWLQCPDNLKCDPKGRLWILTDGMQKIGLCDGIYLAATNEPLPRLLHFGDVPKGYEATGLSFTPDYTTLFVAAQGGGWSGVQDRFPDYAEDRPGRPSVIAITRNDGGIIAG